MVIAAGYSNQVYGRVPDHLEPILFPSNISFKYKQTSIQRHMPPDNRRFATSVEVHQEKRISNDHDEQKLPAIGGCGDKNSAKNVVDNDEDVMEQEEMFVDPYESFEHTNIREWGGPRRGGRLPEPTRYGDWERKGRCTDF